MGSDVRTEDGQSLLRWLRRFADGRVPVEQAFSIIRQLADELHRVHIERPFHRDVIPSTIVVAENPDGSVTCGVPDLGTVAESHGEVGACRYLAPEQWWGGRQNTATDQYALAVLFVELVTGQVPFASAFKTEDETVMRTAVCDHPPKLPEDCPRREVLLRALAKDPRARFHSCSSFVAALLASPAPRRRETSDGAGFARDPSHSRARGASGRPRRLSKMKIAFLVGLLAAGVAWGVRSGFFDRLRASVSAEDARVKRLAEIQKLRAQAAETSAREQAAKLADIRAEILRQEVVAAQALTNLQTFLETEGEAGLSVRREALDRARRTAAEELAALEQEIARTRACEQALAALQTRTIAYSAVAKDIPAESEVALAYKALALETVKMNDLAGTFTEKHPSVVAQRKAQKAALAYFWQTVDGALKHVRATLAAKEGRLEEVRTAAAAALSTFEAAARACQVAQLRQSELMRLREQEANRLAELRRRAFDIQFGAEASATNAP